MFLATYCEYCELTPVAMQFYLYLYEVLLKKHNIRWHLPINISYMITPKLHQSQQEVYPVCMKTSGAM